MPTYINKSSIKQSILSINNEYESILPGGRIETYLILKAPNWEKVLETPYFNLVLQSDETITGSAGSIASISINQKSTKIEIFNGTASLITACFNSDLNMPGFKIYPNSVRNITGVQNRLENLILIFSGTCVVGQCIVAQF